MNKSTSRKILIGLTRKSKTFARIRTSLRRTTPSRALLCVGTIAALTILLSVHFLPDRISLLVGDRSPTEIRANRSVTFVDSEATNRQRLYIGNRIENVYDPDPASVASASRAVSQIFEDVRHIRGDHSLPKAGAKASRLALALGSSFSNSQIQYLLAVPEQKLEHIKDVCAKLVDAQMANPIRSETDDVAHARERVQVEARRELSMLMDVNAVGAVADEALRPNRILNSGKTMQLREIARASVRDVTGEIHMGDVIVREGEIFTQQAMDKCTALGLISPKLDVTTGLSIFGLAAGMMLLIVLYLVRYEPQLYENTRHLTLLAAIVVASVVGLKAFGTMLGISFTGPVFAYLGMMAVVAAGMLIAVLLSPTLAMLVVSLLSVQSGLIMNHEIRFSVMYLLGSLVGIYCVANIRNRTDVLKACGAIAITNTLMIWILGGLLGDSLKEVVSGTIWGVGAAILAVCIFWFGVLVLEKPFGILTHVWLLELSESSHPLLKQLCITAPGTYAHSIMVGNLAEAGAEAIDADMLFCRVASYYHDVGKMKRPHCFAENQGAENVHDKLNPSLSALIIASHVRDGIQFAREYRIPQRIIDIIAEHHGTSLIRYFYQQAVTEGSCGSMRDLVLEQHFRYDGPRPQTRESGIIMMADTIEAAARCLDRPSPARIQGLVEALVHDKLTDGQLDESNLTFRDIQKIQSAFVRVLTAAFHRRVEYPDPAQAEGIAGGLHRDALTPRNANLIAEFAETADPHQAAITSRPDTPAR